jgi:hypothetical protein
MKDAVYGGSQNHEIADSDRHEEIYVIDRRRNRVASGMAVSGHCACQIDPVHQAAAEKRA